MKQLTGIVILLVAVFQTTCTIEDKGRPPTPIRDFVTAGESEAWIVLAKGNLMHLSDDRSVTEISQIGDAVRQISFISRSEGWLLDSNGQFWSTSNGGNQWIKRGKMESDPTSEFGGQLVFASKEAGWLVDGTAVWMTGDGGDSWVEVYREDGMNRGQPTNYFPLDDRSGWLSLSTGGLLKTRDRGSVWESAGLNTDASIHSVFAFSLDECFAPAFERKGIYATVDGGNSWNQALTRGLAEKIGVSSVSFSSREIGWAIGIQFVRDPNAPMEPNGITLKTVDGGKTWKRETDDFYRVAFTRVSFTSPENGWLVSDDTVFRTNDGGLTWHEAFRAR
ncbi:MAG: hypothetical protein IPN69_03470 [Acidobacteria bacterium]|nr:hypothetical protein [Acidobacteriota bacterium]